MNIFPQDLECSESDPATTQSLIRLMSPHFVLLFTILFSGNLVHFIFFVRIFLHCKFNEFNAFQASAFGLCTASVTSPYCLAIPWPLLQERNDCLWDSSHSGQRIRLMTYLWSQTFFFNYPISKYPDVMPLSPMEGKAPLPFMWKKSPNICFALQVENRKD